MIPPLFMLLDRSPKSENLVVTVRDNHQNPFTTDSSGLGRFGTATLFQMPTSGSGLGKPWMYYGFGSMNAHYAPHSESYCFLFYPEPGPASSLMCGL